MACPTTKYVMGSITEEFVYTILNFNTLFTGINTMSSAYKTFLIQKFQCDKYIFSFNLKVFF